MRAGERTVVPKRVGHSNSQVFHPDEDGAKDAVDEEREGGVSEGYSSAPACHRAEGWWHGAEGSIPTAVTSPTPRWRATG